MSQENETTLGFRLLRAFSVPKKLGEGNEDRWLSNSDGSVAAVSDGASVSFDPGPWAETLVRHFVETPEVDLEWLQAAANEYRDAYDREAMPWMQQAAFDRGSFATLAGLVSSRDGTPARGFAVGDSLIVLLDGERCVRTFPYVDVAEFDASPWLFSTTPRENRHWSEDHFRAAWIDLHLASCASPRVLLMTDAVGRWLLEDIENRARALLEVPDSESFGTLVDDERAQGRMRRDDCTLVIMGAEG